MLMSPPRELGELCKGLAIPLPFLGTVLLSMLIVKTQSPDEV